MVLYHTLSSTGCNSTLWSRTCNDHLLQKSLPIEFTHVSLYKYHNTTRTPDLWNIPRYGLHICNSSALRITQYKDYLAAQMWLLTLPNQITHSRVRASCYPNAAYVRRSAAMTPLDDIRLARPWRQVGRLENILYNGGYNQLINTVEVLKVKG